MLFAQISNRIILEKKLNVPLLCNMYIFWSKSLEVIILSQKVCHFKHVLAKINVMHSWPSYHWLSSAKAELYVSQHAIIGASWRWCKSSSWSLIRACWHWLASVASFSFHCWCDENISMSLMLKIVYNDSVKWPIAVLISDHSKKL